MSSNATQLSYTRGAVVPISLLVRCSDDQVLDLLTSPTSPVVKLLCNVEFSSRMKAKQDHKPSMTAHGPLNASYYGEFRSTQSASWWTPRASDKKLDPSSRRLMGEIHVDPRLKPGLQTPEFRIFVCVPVSVTESYEPITKAWIVHHRSVCTYRALFCDIRGVSKGGWRAADATRLKRGRNCDALLAGLPATDCGHAASVR
jgi:hypothetical protein